jgi:hypothetical protein
MGMEGGKPKVLDQILAHCYYSIDEIRFIVNDLIVTCAVDSTAKCLSNSNHRISLSCCYPMHLAGPLF